MTNPTLDTTALQGRLDAGKRLLATAQNDFDNGVRGLLASDGRTPIHGPDEHERRLAALRETLAGKVATVDSQADAVIASIEAARLSEHADPLASLDLATLELAGTHRVFVKEDCETLPIPQLIGRLEWAGKYPGAYLRVLYARYGLARFQSLLDAQPQPDGLPAMRDALESLGAIGAARGLTPDAERVRFAAAGLKRATAAALAGNKPGLGMKISL